MKLLLYELLLFSLLVPWCYSLYHCGSCTYECHDCDCNFHCPSTSVHLSCINKIHDEIDISKMVHCSGILLGYYNYGDYVHVKRVNVIITDVISGVMDDSEYIHINSDYSASYIFSIDLSNNKYDYIPISTELIGLHKINISRNSLMEAKLSNSQELSELIEIDYSYNKINRIEVSSLKYPFKNMQILNLSHNYLVSIPDAIFSALTKLETLDLSHNSIDSLSVLTFEGIKNLLNLYISHNRISNINNFLLRFNFLEVIDISHNEIEIIKSHDFEKLVNLRTLDLSSNNLLSIEKNAFKTTLQLKVLDISTNRIETIDQETFFNNNNLENINFSRNNLTELPKDLFKNKNLTSFTIEGNRLAGALIKGTFEGLKFVNELDLSNQQLTFIEDYAFFGLENITKLLLQDNKIQRISIDAFRNLQHLQVLDLSNNLLTNIGFEKKDLISLYSFILQNNFLAQVKPEYFHSLHKLQFLDLSYNKILQIKNNSFMSLKDLINMEISNNPVSGALEESTFDGLISLPTLDMSDTMLTTINNGSFQGLIQLKNLSISHSNVSAIQFNSFLKTGALQSIDLSYNRLTSFEVNTTELNNLNTLKLNNNLLITITSTSLKGLPRLTELYLSHNNITDIQNEAFAQQIDLRYLDLSYNTQFNFNISHIGNAQYWESMIFHTNITFEYVGDIPLSVLKMTHSGIENITKIVLKRFKQLDTLELSNNDIVKVESGAFSNITKLRKLDLSFNKIKFIQPGTFKDNANLFSLNMSHNSLTAISYGILRGLGNLNTIDISYNNIDSLESERFYEVTSLSVLVVDHNKISLVKADDFVGTSLSKLSIGDNPLPCKNLVNLKKTKISFVITAIRLNERSDENVDGVTCNINSYRTTEKSSSNLTENDEVLVDIRDILRYMKTDNVFINMSKEIEKTGSVITFENNSTNVLLDKMLKVLTSMNAVRDAPVSIPKDRNKIKQNSVDTIPVEKPNIFTEVENKISSITPTNTKSIVFESSPNNEMLSTIIASESKSLIFIEICVGITLLILVVFVLFILYRFSIFVPRSRKRNQPEAMDIATL